MKYLDFEFLINSIDPYDHKKYYIDENETVELIQTPHDPNPEYDVNENSLVSFCLNVNGSSYAYWGTMDYYNSLHRDKRAIREMYNEIRDILFLEKEKLEKIICTFD